MWQHTGTHRPEFALEPGPGQESVWDYPRPPSIEAEQRLVEVKYKQTLIARSNQIYRVLETASPPTFYLPPEDIDFQYLKENTSSSFCEWKGQASYFDLQHENGLIQNVAWCYRNPLPRFVLIKDYVCFYPSRLDCFVDGAKVKPQTSDYYGGWITPEIVGPFKGDPGTETW
jgi:uncharacterized protein (DUF427 family)